MQRKKKSTGLHVDLTKILFTEDNLNIAKCKMYFVDQDSVIVTSQNCRQMKHIVALQVVNIEQWKFEQCEMEEVVKVMTECLVDNGVSKISKNI